MLEFLFEMNFSLFARVWQGIRFWEARLIYPFFPLVFNVGREICRGVIHSKSRVGAFY